MGGCGTLLQPLPRRTVLRGTSGVGENMSWAGTFSCGMVLVMVVAVMVVSRGASCGGNPTVAWTVVRGRALSLLSSSSSSSFAWQSLPFPTQTCKFGGSRRQGQRRAMWTLLHSRDEEEEEVNYDDDFDEDEDFPGRVVNATEFSRVNRSRNYEQDVIWPIQYRVGGGIDRKGVWVSSPTAETVARHGRYEVPFSTRAASQTEGPSVVDKYGRLWQSVPSLAKQELLRIGLPQRLQQTVTLPKSGKSISIPLPWDCGMMAGISQEQDRGRYVYPTEMVRRFRQEGRQRRRRRHRRKRQEEGEGGGEQEEEDEKEAKPSKSDSDSVSNLSSTGSNPWDGLVRYEFDPQDDCRHLDDQNDQEQQVVRDEHNDEEVKAEVDSVTYNSLPFYGGTADATGTTIVVAKYNALDANRRKSLSGRAVMGWVGHFSDNDDDHDPLEAMQDNNEEEETALGLSLVDSFAFDDERWAAHYDKLVEFYAMHGHSNVGRDWPSDVSLPQWVARQRDQYTFLQRNHFFRHEMVGPKAFGQSRVSLTSWRIQLLFDLGFLFRTQWTWRQRYKQLQSYRERYGTVNVEPSNAQPDAGAVAEEEDNLLDEGLYLWLRSQRALRRRWLYQQEQQEKEQAQGQQTNFELYSDDDDDDDDDDDKLSLKQRFQLLDELGVDWSPLDTQWERRLDQLRQFRAKHGHADVTKSQDMSLALWLVDVRQQYRLYQNAQQAWQSTLTEERIQMLDELQITWEPLQRQWQERYQELLEYYETHGHCQVTSSDDPKYAHLMPWIHQQRVSFRRGTLAASRLEQLQALGFVFDVAQDSFERGMQKLRAFRDEFGHVNVPVSYEDRALVFFVKQQRRLRREQLGLGRDDDDEEEEDDEQEEDQEDEDAVETITSAQESTTTRATTGTFDTETTTKDRHALTPGRIRQLDELGFVWDVRQDMWMQNYQKLLAFGAAHGHVDVPTDYVDASLYNFVAWHRRYHAKGSAALTPKRRELLEALGFTWNTQQAQWMERYRQLQDYRQRFGDCNVPREWKENPALAKWVKWQRTQYSYWKEGNKRSNLSDERRHLLEKIGFAWRLGRRTSKKTTTTTTSRRRSEKKR